MQKFMRWSAMLVVLMLVLAACSPTAAEMPARSQRGSEPAASEPAAQARRRCATQMRSAASRSPRVTRSGSPARSRSPATLRSSATTASTASRSRSRTAPKWPGTRSSSSRRTLAAATPPPARRPPRRSWPTRRSSRSSARPARAPRCRRCRSSRTRASCMISPSNTAPSLTDPDSEEFGGPFYFRTAYNDKVQGAAVAQFACDELGVDDRGHDPRRQPVRRAAAAGVRSTSSPSICGGETTAQEAINVGDTEFRQLLTTIAADSPGAPVLPDLRPGGSAHRPAGPGVAGLADTILFGADGVKDQGFIDAAGDIAEDVGMYFSGPDLNFGDAGTRTTSCPAYTRLSGEDGADRAVPRTRLRRVQHHLRCDRVRARSRTTTGRLYIPQGSAAGVRGRPDRLRRPDRHA